MLQVSFWFMQSDAPVLDVSEVLEAISNKSFGPNSLLVPRFKSSKHRRIPVVYDPQREYKQMGNPALRGNLVPPRLRTKIRFLSWLLVISSGSANDLCRIQIRLSQAHNWVFSSNLMPGFERQPGLQPIAAFNLQKSILFFSRMHVIEHFDIANRTDLLSTLFTLCFPPI